MAIPPFHHFIDPALRIAADGQARRRSELIESTVRAMHLSEEQLTERMRGGGLRAPSRAGWAIAYLDQAGALERPERGVLQISRLGRELLAANPNGVTLQVLESTEGLQAWGERSRRKAEERRLSAQQARSNHTSDAELIETDSPLEQLIEGLELLNLSVASELVSRIQQLPPEFLEHAVLELLHKMGYGGSRDDGEHLGKSHDGGIDGVIRQDALGVERIYIQAKRYKSDNTVGAGAIREFVGALTHAGAAGGVVITTSSFSPDAKRFAGEAKPIRVVLIDGEELGRLMVRYQVGVVVTQTLHITQVDENFFEN